MTRGAAMGLLAAGVVLGVCLMYYWNGPVVAAIFLAIGVAMIWERWRQP